MIGRYKLANLLIANLIFFYYLSLRNHEPFTLLTKFGLLTMHSTGLAHADASHFIAGTAFFLQYGINFIAVQLVKFDEQRPALPFLIKLNNDRNKFFHHKLIALHSKETNRVHHMLLRLNPRKQ